MSISIKHENTYYRINVYEIDTKGKKTKIAFSPTDKAIQDLASRTLAQIYPITGQERHLGVEESGFTLSRFTLGSDDALKLQSPDFVTLAKEWLSLLVKTTFQEGSQPEGSSRFEEINPDHLLELMRVGN